METTHVEAVVFWILLLSPDLLKSYDLDFNLRRCFTIVTQETLLIYLQINSMIMHFAVYKIPDKQTDTTENSTFCDFDEDAS